MNRDIILSKIESLERCIHRIQSKTPQKKEILYNNLDHQDIIVLNLERAVQLSVDIASHIIADLSVKAPMSMSDSFASLASENVITQATALRMQKSVGFRNIAVHEYNVLSWDVVYAIITEHLGDFKEYARQIMVWIDKQDAPCPSPSFFFTANQ